MKFIVKKVKEAEARRFRAEAAQLREELTNRGPFDEPDETERLTRSIAELERVATVIERQVAEACR